jgi:hypothetical protein
VLNHINFFVPSVVSSTANTLSRFTPIVLGFSFKSFRETFLIEPKAIPSVFDFRLMFIKIALIILLKKHKSTFVFATFLIKL